jgi:hypothetical protein
LFICALTKYIIPARWRSSIPAGQTFKLDAPHLIKGGQEMTDFGLGELKGGSCFAHPLQGKGTT